MVAGAVVVAAGRGDRFGAPDKVLRPLAGRPLLAHVLDAIEAATSVRDLVVVVAPHTRSAVEALIAGGSWTKPRAVVLGGAERQDSVANGVAATRADVPVVVVHDAARPLAGPDLFDRCVATAAVRGAAIAAVPVTDTIKRVRGDLVRETVPRDELWAAQTPQAFRRDLLVASLADPRASGATFTDEAGLLESLGHPVAIVAGDPFNLKVTVAGDLAIADAILRSRRPPAARTERAPVGLRADD